MMNKYFNNVHAVRNEGTSWVKWNHVLYLSFIESFKCTYGLILCLQKVD